MTWPIAHRGQEVLETTNYYVLKHACCVATAFLKQKAQTGQTKRGFFRLADPVCLYGYPMQLASAPHNIL